MHSLPAAKCFPGPALGLECEELAVPSGATSPPAPSMVCYVMILLLLPKPSVLGRRHPSEGELLACCVTERSGDHFSLPGQYLYDGVMRFNKSGAAKESRELEVEMVVVVVGLGLGPCVGDINKSLKWNIKNKKNKS